MNVDRGVLIALATGGSRKNEIRNFLRCAKLTDDLHVVERGPELRSIRKPQDSPSVVQCRPLVANLLRGCRTESKGDEEERPNSHEAIVRLARDDANVTSVAELITVETSS